MTLEGFKSPHSGQISNCSEEIWKETAYSKIFKIFHSKSKR